MRRPLVALATLLVACSSSPDAKRAVEPPPAPSASVAPAASSSAAAAKKPPQAVPGDTERTTPSGVKYLVPARWAFESEADVTVVHAPEGDTKLALVENEAKSADEAVTAAWAAIGAPARTPKISTPRPARRGWDERRVFDYELPPNERAVVQALALRKGTKWTVLLVDGKSATIEKRLAQVILFDDMLRPPGWAPETFAGKKANVLDAARVKKLTDFVETAQRELGVPGVGLALVQGGKVVFEGGLGVRELGKKEKVTADTRFMVASNTKGMTTLLLAKLVDEGKLRWEDPVEKVFPGFRLGDAATTAKVEVRHLVCACTGLPREDLPWILEFAKSTPKSSLDLLAGMQPTTKFGETFQYSNLLAAAGGWVAAHVVAPKEELGKAYDQAMQSRVFGPLGMKSATFDDDLALRSDHASPHGDDFAGVPVVAAFDLNRSVVPVRPAGGAWVSARDMAKYVQLELSEGKLPSGKPLVSKDAFLARRAKQVTIGSDTIYGMGLETDTAWGTPVVHHGGSLFGYKSDFYAFTEHGVGAVVLTNANSGGVLLRPFLRKLAEVLFDARDEADEDLATRAKNRKAQMKKAREELTFPPDATLVSGLAAKYRSKELGELVVKKDGADVVFDFGESKAKVASRKHADGTVVFETVDPLFFGVELVVATRDDKRALVVRDAQHEYVFVAE